MQRERLFPTAIAADSERRQGDAGAQTDGSDDHAAGRDVTASDVTERVQAEAMLRRLSLAVEQTPASVVITDTQGVIQYVNPAFERVTGYSRDEAIGATPRILKSGITPQAVYDDMWQTISSGQVWSGELCNRRKNGELYWDSGTVSPIRGAGGAITNYVSVKEDITERKKVDEELGRYRLHLEELVETRTATLRAEIALRARTEATLRESEQRLAEAQHIAQIGSWDWDSHSNTLAWSDETYRICGAPPGTRPSYEGFLEGVHAEDREMVRQALEQAVAHGTPVSLDLRFIRPDGTPCVLSLTAVPSSDSAGNLTRVVGALQDISERTRIKLELLDKERMTKELAIGRSIQLSMLPRAYPHAPGWEFACRYRAAEQLGGDLYDFIPLPRGDIGVVIGDVSGHGLPAALYMALCCAVVKTTALTQRTPAKTLARSNRILHDNYSGDEFVSVCYGVLNTGKGTFTLANAGHNRPLVYAAATGGVVDIATKGVILGIQPNKARLQEVCLSLAAGDVLLLYTDGISEGFDDEGNQFGTDRLRRILAETGTRSAEDILQAISSAWQAFVGKNVEADDTTLLVIKRSGPPAA